MLSFISESGLGFFWKPVEITAFHIIIFLIIVTLIIFLIYKKVTKKRKDK